MKQSTSEQGKVKCEVCGKELIPAPARFDGEPTFVGYLPHDCQPPKPNGEQEGNKLISEFMGEKRRYESTEQIFLENLKYHSSWDWLMPVVEKIEKLGYHTDITCYLDEQKCNIWEGTPQGDGGKFANDIATTEKDFNDDSKIITVWLCVIQFIQWYNKTQHHGK